MPASSRAITGLGFADVADSACEQLGPGWTAHPQPFTHRSGTLRSARGHYVQVHGGSGEEGFTVTGHMPYGPDTRLELQPHDTSVTGHGRALADVIANRVVPEYDAKDPALRAIHSVVRARLGRSATIRWENGTGIVTWQLDAGGHAEARCATAPNGYDSSTAVTFMNLTPDQAATVLVATDTGSPGSDIPVHGPLAQRAKTAGPGLLPVTSFTYDARGEHTTVLATPEFGIKVRITRPHQPDACCDIRLEGRGNALAAILATS